MNTPRLDRRFWLALAAAATLIAVAWTAYRDAAVIGAARPRASGDRAPAGQAAPPRALTQSAPPAAAAPPMVDIFAVRSWEPPAPPPVAANAGPVAPPAPPEAPPLPFRFLGRILEAGKPAVFLLAQGDQVLAVTVGNTIDASYRLQKFENGQLHFLYRPMNADQTLAVGNEDDRG